MTGEAVQRRGGRGHVLIAGTGRAGTTLLMRILTSLGLDTGFSEADIAEVEGRIGRAGLEKPVTRRTAPTLPEIVKAPLVVDVLAGALRQGWLKVDLAIIPVRNLAEAAASRARVSAKASERGEDPMRAPGGLWKTSTPDNQHWVLAEQFYRVIEPLVMHEIPIHFLSFPRYVNDADYFLRALGDLLEIRFGLEGDAVRAAHSAECRPDFISRGLSR